jgi:DUF2075 family protein
MQKYCGWAGSIGAFLAEELTPWLDSQNAFLKECMNEYADNSQTTAWKSCFNALQTELKKLLELTPESTRWCIIFEYELPRERGRRPDVIILAGQDLIVLEFKGYPTVDQADIDQVQTYARDLSEYHSTSHDREINTALILGGRKERAQKSGNVFILSTNHISHYLNSLELTDPTPIDLMTWLEGEYAPLPSIISAARTIFNNEDLPQIRQAQSAGIQDAVDELTTIVQTAKENNERHLVLVTGVPGAGKTLLGLQFVYHDHFNSGEDKTNSIFLSGNGPLVKVLQHALSSRVFVRDVHGFLKQHGGSSKKIPRENIFVYDEAQRAWDAARVMEKRKHNLSEPDDFIRIGDNKDGWAVMVGLIGEGQEIHLGEESGIEQWADAVKNSSNTWKINGPEKLQRLFSKTDYKDSPNLDLNHSLRSHLASDLHHWVHLLLSGDLDQANDLAPKIHSQGYTLYVTRDLDLGKAYIKNRYKGELDKRYGLMGSSKATILDEYGIRTGWNYSKRFREGPWYNDPVDSQDSCCQFGDAATEFSCQGLELDFPLVGWGKDLSWKDECWYMKPSPRSKAKAPYTLRLNSYRVLLTRGRDGMIIFVPSLEFLDETYEALTRAGAIELKRKTD